MQYTEILDGKACNDAGMIDQVRKDMSVQQCYEHCVADPSCTHFTWFEKVACRRYSACPETGRYTTSTQPAKTYQVIQETTAEIGRASGGEGEQAPVDAESSKKEDKATMQYTEMLDVKACTHAATHDQVRRDRLVRQCSEH